MIFAPDDAPSSVARVLTDIGDLATGKSITQLLELVSRKLKTTDSDGDTPMVDSQALSDDEDDYDFEEDEDDEDAEEYFPDEDIGPKAYVEDKGPTSQQSYTKPTSAFRHRIRADLMTAKANGFKVGHHGGLMDGLGCYVSLSCRISKLGISEEAMRAWQVEPDEYLVAIFHYPSGYKSMDSMKSYDISTGRRCFGARVGICSTYKPTMQEAILAFTKLSKEDEKRREEQSQPTKYSGSARGFRNCFISRPLNELLEERFLTLLNYRYNGMPWDGAETFYNDKIGAQSVHAELGLEEHYLEPEISSAVYPPLVTADHITESTDSCHSLPLVGMQFILRHFVRCTDFCLVCFSKMPDDLQAIKPYVCEKPLCLYQYMSLGFGPSIEHEIQSQPKVVDLLISFCYVSARLGKLKHFPTGLSLMVPSSSAYDKDYVNQQQDPYSSGYHAPSPDQPPVTNEAASVSTKIRYNEVTREILFEKKDDKCPLRVGDWVIIRLDHQINRPMHCRVAETALYPTVKVAAPVEPVLPLDPRASNQPVSSVPSRISNTPQQATKVTPKAVNEFQNATYFTYDQNFDDLHDYHKREAIYALLDILPSVSDMKDYLSTLR